MLQHALVSRLPLIQINTDDTVNIAEVVNAYIPEETVELFERDSFEAFGYYILHGGEEIDDYDKLYTRCLDNNATVLIINPEEDVPQAFQISEVIVPIEMIKEKIQFLVGSVSEEIVPLLRGMSLKDIHALLSVTLAEHGGVSREILLRAKAKLFSDAGSGLYSVDAEMDFYAEEEKLTKWLEENYYFFSEYTGKLHEQLRPRGLLLYGEPGVGKTAAAKFLANQFGVPLFRLDIGTIMRKYVGESERRLDASLMRLEHEAPCVVLLDEVEKLFVDEEGGVGSRLLAKLLWWLQEHKSSVFTVMTCNDMEVIPPELYRHGRIDDIILLQPLEKQSALRFVWKLLAELECNPTKKACLEIVGPEDYTLPVNGISHAELVAKVRTYLKHRFMKKEG